MFSTLTVALTVSPWFDWDADALSFLGMAGRPSSPLFNGGLISGGILTLIFSLGIVERFQHPITRAGAIILPISSIALASIGVFPYPGPSHEVAAVVFFLSLPIAMFVIGTGFLVQHKWKFGIATIPVGAITIILCIMTIAIMAQDSSAVAISEVLFSLTISGWVIFFSIMLLRGHLEENNMV
jgi:hypothetical membrane protein